MEDTYFNDEYMFGKVDGPIYIIGNRGPNTRKALANIYNTIEIVLTAHQIIFVNI